jgi:hypothetical protein
MKAGCREATGLFVSVSLFSVIPAKAGIHGSDAVAFL